MTLPGLNEPVARPGTFLLLFIVALVAGTLLRFDQIGAQIVADDEWHGINAGVDHDGSYIASHFGEGDHSIPLALYYKVVREHFSLSEMTLRTPVLGAGLLALFFFPLLLRRIVGDGVAGTFALLLAISPLHVYYSRYARPYSFAFLFSGLALLGFHRWLQSGKRKWLALYWIGAILGPYFHLTVLPFVAAPLLFGLIPRAWTRPQDQASRYRRIFVAGSGLLLGIGLLLGVPLVQDATTLAGKSFEAEATIRTLLTAVSLLGGTRHTALLAVLGVLSGIGLIRLFRWDRCLVFLALFTSLLQVVMVVLSRADQLQAGIVFVRYSLPLLFVFLMAVAAGLDFLERLLARLRLPPSLGTICCTALFLLGPLPAIHTRPNGWTNHGLYQYNYSVWPERKQKIETGSFLKRVPDLYLRLREEQVSREPILEAPWYFEWQNNQHYAIYQQIHGSEVFLARPEADRAEGLNLWRFVDPLDHQGIRDRKIAIVLFHHDTSRELRNSSILNRVDVADWIREYQEMYGQPFYKDRFMTAFRIPRHSTENGRIER